MSGKDAGSAWVFGFLQDDRPCRRDGGDLDGVGGPHDVRRLGDDVAVVRGLGPLTGTERRQS